MGLLTRIKKAFGQLAETGVAQPHQTHNNAAVEITRTDLPPCLPHELPRAPLAPDLPEPPARVH